MKTNMENTNYEFRNVWKFTIMSGGERYENVYKYRLRLNVIIRGFGCISCIENYLKQLKISIQMLDI